LKFCFDYGNLIYRRSRDKWNGYPAKGKYFEKAEQKEKIPWGGSLPEAGAIIIWRKK